MTKGNLQVMALETGRRNPAAAFLEGAGSFSPNTCVTAVSAVILAIVVHLGAAEWGSGLGPN